MTLQSTLIAEPAALSPEALVEQLARDGRAAQPQQVGEAAGDDAAGDAGALVAVEGLEVGEDGVVVGAHGADVDAGAGGFERLARIGDGEAVADEVRQRHLVLQPHGEMHRVIVVARRWEGRAADRQVLHRQVARRNRLGADSLQRR